jgi:hypothetical protein
MASLPTSACDAKTKPDYEGPHGWRAAIQKEVTRVQNFGAITLVPAKDARAARAAFGDDQVTIGHIVLAFHNKTDPSGNPLDDDISRKARITIADKRGKSTEHNFYSACVGSSTDRIVTQIAVEKRAIQHTKDVGGIITVIPRHPRMADVLCTPLFHHGWPNSATTPRTLRTAPATFSTSPATRQVAATQAGSGR